MNILLFTLSGFVSGLISYGLTFSIEANTIHYLAGIIFAGCIGYSSKHLKRIQLYRLVPWLVASTASYYAAVNVTLSILSKNDQSQYFAFFVGGATGAFLLLLGFHFFISRISILSFIILVLTGGVLGLSWFFGGTLKNWFGGDNAYANLFSLYIVWQTGMALGLGIATSCQAQKEIIS